MEINLQALPDVKGKTLVEATNMLANYGISTVRPTIVNGIPQIVTQDMRADRLNVSTDKGLISHVGRIG